MKSFLPGLDLDVFDYCKTDSCRGGGRHGWEGPRAGSFTNSESTTLHITSHDYHLLLLCRDLLVLDSSLTLPYRLLIHTHRFTVWRCSLFLAHVGLSRLL
jgi:hypothetical protein